MSDSDSDNAYTDYLNSRRVAVQKKKKPAIVDSDDSDDDEFNFTESPAEPKKKRRMCEEEVEEVSFVVDNHGQRLRSKIDEMEEEYKRKLFAKEASVIPCTSSNGGKYNTVLTKTIKVCETLKGVTSATIEDDDDEIVVEEVEVKVKDPQDQVEEVDADMFPVTVEILDCELTRKSQRHELEPTATFEEVLREYASSWKCHINSVMLNYNGIIVEKEQTPRDLGLRPLQIPYPRLEVYKKEEEENKNTEIFTIEGTPDFITVKAQFKNRKKPIYLKLYNETTLLEIKELIVAQLLEEHDPEIPDVDSMKVMFDDEYLTELDATCQDIGLEEADCIDVYVK